MNNTKVQNSNIVIDSEKCIKCGLCAKECSLNCIEMTNNSPTITENMKFCISCQHCFAVCPKGAISFKGKQANDADPIKEFENPDILLNLIKSRRSIRNYKNKNIEPEKIEKLKEMLNWIPTGCNAHNLRFAIVEDKDAMDIIRNYTNSKLKSMLKNITQKGAMGFYRDSIIDGKDVVFRNAPHMIVVSEPKTSPCVAIDPTIALSYFDLYAQSLGVGTLWCGFAEICLKLFPELCNTFEIPETHKVSRVMLFGESEVKFVRTTLPDKFEITTINNPEFKKLSLISKIKKYLANGLKY